MSQRKVLGAGIVLALAAILAVVAYIVVAQIPSFPPEWPILGACANNYTPWGLEATVPARKTMQICIPHGVPFRLAVAQIPVSEAQPGATGYITAIENNCCLSWVGQHSDGTATHGCKSMGQSVVILQISSASAGMAMVTLDSSATCTEPPTGPELGRAGHTITVSALCSLLPVRVTLVR